MSFYKVENGMLIKAPEKSLKIFIANPTEEQYKFFGYTNKIVEEMESPEEQEGKYIEEYYEQIDGVIYKRFRLVDIPDEVGISESETE